MSRRWFVLSISICLLIITIFSAMFKFDNERIKMCKNNNYLVNTDEIKYCIDSMDNDGKYINITGWFFVVNKELRYVDREVVLQDEKGDLYKLNTNMVVRKDVTNAYRNSINYDKSGFHARGIINMLKENTTYKIGILYSYEDEVEKLFITDKIIKAERR